MNNTELTLDQLSEVSGGATAIEYGLIAACVPLRIRKTRRLETRIGVGKNVVMECYPS